MGIWYATREQVMSSMETFTTARAASIIDQKLESASRSVEEQLHRRLYPEDRTVRLDWPNDDYGPSWKLDLQANELISATSVVSGGVTLTQGTDYVLRRDDDLSEPPYSRIEILLSGANVFTTADTWQRAVVIQGTFGYSLTDTSVTHATLGANINTSVTTVTLNPAQGADINRLGTGALLQCGTERMTVVARYMADTGINTAGTLTDRQATGLLAVGSGAAFVVGEIILIEAERMRIDDIAGNNLIVTRAYDGSTLASHAFGLDIYALRSYTVRRGVLGSPATSHTSGDGIYYHQYPGLANELTIAETVVALEQNASAYARIVGQGGASREVSGQGLEDIRKAAYWGLGRTQRSAAV